MKRHVMVAVMLAIVAADSHARIRSVRHPGGVPEPQSVLWIAAHPDDEAVAAPLLAKWCLDGGARCGLLVLTRGEAGPCALTHGCVPDVATVRSSEAGAASELFQAESILLRLADGGGILAPRWSLPGEDRAVVARIAAQIAAFQPELVLTFDPRHGTTCHPDHRATGRLVLDAVASLEVRPEMYLLETVVTFGADAGSPQFSTALADALRFDANQPLRSGDAAWTAVAWDMERHRSQFTTELIDAVRNVPHDARSVFLAPAETALAEAVAPCR